MLEHELQTAVALARLAGKSILEHYATDFVTEEKLGVDDHFEPVTIADRDASRIIVSGLEAAFPDDAVLSEEEADDVARGPQGDFRRAETTLGEAEGRGKEVEASAH